MSLPSAPPTSNNLATCSSNVDSQEFFGQLRAFRKSEYALKIRDILHRTRWERITSAIAMGVGDFSEPDSRARAQLVCFVFIIQYLTKTSRSKDRFKVYCQDPRCPPACEDFLTTRLGFEILKFNSRELESMNCQLPCICASTITPTDIALGPAPVYITGRSFLFVPHLCYPVAAKLASKLFNTPELYFGNTIETLEEWACRQIERQEDKIIDQILGYVAEAITEIDLHGAYLLLEAIQRLTSDDAYEHKHVGNVPDDVDEVEMVLPGYFSLNELDLYWKR